jgi:hypothetical protein
MSEVSNVDIINCNYQLYQPIHGLGLSTKLGRITHDPQTIGWYSNYFAVAVVVAEKCQNKMSSSSSIFRISRKKIREFLNYLRLTSCRAETTLGNVVKGTVN